jgi:hypothetical protein
MVDVTITGVDATDHAVLEAYTQSKYGTDLATASKEEMDRRARDVREGIVNGWWNGKTLAEKETLKAAN